MRLGTRPGLISRGDTNTFQGMNGSHLHGGTTVSGTMILAHLAGIRVFGTGGLGKIALQCTRFYS